MYSRWIRGYYCIIKDQLLDFLLDHRGQKPGTSSLTPTSSASASQSPGFTWFLSSVPPLLYSSTPIFFFFFWIFSATPTQPSTSPPSKWASKNRKLIVGAIPLYPCPTNEPSMAPHCSLDKAHTLHLGLYHPCRLTSSPSPTHILCLSHSME